MGRVVHRCIVLLAAGISSLASAQVETPARPVTDPRSLSSPVDPAARPVPLDDLSYSRSVGSVAWSADGRQVFLVTDLTGRMNLWRVDRAGGWPVQIVQSDDAQTDLAVTPDGGTVVYAQDRGGDERYDLYAVPADGGAVVNLTGTPDISERGALIGPDSRTIAVAARQKGKGQANIAVIDRITRQVRSLTDEGDPRHSWTPVAWIDRGRALVANRYAVDQSQSEIWRIDVASAKATRLAGEPGVTFRAAAAAADGSVLAATTNRGTGRNRAGLLDLRGGGWRWLPPTAWEQTAEGMAPDGRAMLVRDNVDGRTTLSLVDVAKLRVRRVPLPDGFNDLPADQPFSPDGAMLLARHTSASTPADLQLIDVARGTARPLTRLAMASIDPAHLARSAVVTYRSFDGTLVSAIVLMPPNLSRDGTNAAIVLPHGGPTAQAIDIFNSTAVALASRGYIVIAPNFRGSTGYGQAFQKANYKDLGGGDLKDVLAARDFLLASGYVDRRRIGIMGASYGGFLTLMAIGREPDLFAAAVQYFGIVDWRTMWERQDAFLQAYQRSLMGSPTEDPAVYDAASPLTYLSRARTPLLSLQGENDIRVPRVQAQQVADALKKAGVTTETVFYPAEGHGFQKRENQMDSLKRTVDWFDRYLKPAERK